MWRGPGAEHSAGRLPQPNHAWPQGIAFGRLLADVAAVHHGPEKTVNRGHREIGSTSQVGQAHRPASISQVLEQVEHTVHRLHPCGCHDASRLSFHYAESV